MPLSSLVIRRALHAGAFAAIVGVMAVTPLTPVDAQKGKPPAPQNLELTFANREGDLITSDGGSYFNGQDGVSASINSSSGDLTVSFSTSRHINVALGTPLAGSTEPVPSPDVYEARRLYVNDIQGVPFGTPQLRIARILDFPNLTNHVVGFLATHNSGTPAGGTPVCVTRDSMTEWTITSTAVDGCSPGGIGGLFTQENGRKGTIVITPLASYVLPFSLSVQLQ